jgi:hypothetical protein
VYGLPDSAASGRRDTDFASLTAKALPVVRCPTGFDLPLVNHFVQQCIAYLVPPVLNYVKPTDGDLYRTVRPGVDGQLAESRHHPARHAEGYWVQPAPKMPVVEFGVQTAEPPEESAIGRVRLLPTSTAHRHVGLGRELAEHPSGALPLGARGSRCDESHDRPEHSIRSVCEPAVNPEHGPLGHAHHHGAIDVKLNRYGSVKPQTM